MLRTTPKEGETSGVVKWRDIVRARPLNLLRARPREGETSEVVEGKTSGDC